MRDKSQILLEQLYHTTYVLGEGVYDPGIFKAVALIGPMGAGKSTIAQKLLALSSKGLRTVNLDDFNEMLLRKGQVEGGNLTADQLEQSWQSTQKRKEGLINGRIGLIIDGSGRKIESVTSPLDEVEKLGYDTMVIAVNVTLQTSLTRQQSRAAKQAEEWGTGRNVPENLAITSHADIQKNLPVLQQKYGNRFILVSNENVGVSAPNVDGVQYTSPEKAAQIVGQFMRTPPSKPEALEWIQTEKQKRNRLNPGQTSLT